MSMKDSAKPDEPAAEPAMPPPDGSSLDPQSVEGLFLLALQKKTPAEREAYVAQICGEDKQRHRRVTALLRAYEDAGSFLETPAVDRTSREEVSLRFLAQTEKDGCLGTIGPYEVTDVIGRGGMGIVMRAFDPKLNRVVAIKVLIPELAANPNARRRFLREARAAAAVTHPHVVTIHAVEESAVHGVDQQTSTPPYLVMECVVGHSLQQKLNQVGSLSLDATLRISRQIADGLAAAHSQGLVHRDIKPANILLENGVERVKITDFGLARAVDDVTVTRTGELSGTPQYMAPEQAAGERTDHRSDLFSLGCVMYAMCTGHSPFRADSLAHVIKRVTQDKPRPISEQNAEVPDWLIEIIDGLLQKEPGKRIQDAQQLAGILDQHLAFIQQAGNSESHSLINKQVAAIAPPSPEEHPTSETRAKPRRWSRRKIGSGLLWLGTALVVGAFAGMLTLIGNPSILDAIPHLDRNSHQIILAAMGAGILLLIAGTILRGQDQGASTSVLAFYILLGPLGIVLWLIDRDRRERRIARAKTDAENGPALRDETIRASGESVHGKVGRTMILLGLFLVALPPLLLLAGPIIRDGDIMELGGRMALIACPAGLLAVAIGYVLRYIVDSQQDRHQRLRLHTPILVAVLVVAFGATYQWRAERRLEVPHHGKQGRSAIVAPIPANPRVTLEHPAIDVRRVMVNKGGSTIAKVSPTETRLMLPHKLLGTRIDIHLIATDGCEYVRYGFPLERLEDTIHVTGADLDPGNRILVEVVDDVPDVELCMVSYPTQAISVNTFTIGDRPFHKLLPPGEHELRLTYIAKGATNYGRIVHAVNVTGSEPIQLSLGEMIKEQEERWPSLP